MPPCFCIFAHWQCPTPGSSGLWVTTIHPIFGVLRFLQLVAGRPKAESPTQEMLSDVPFVLNLAIWVAVVVAIIYRLRPG